MTEPSYTPLSWADSPATTSPIDAANLSHLEDGVKAATDRAVASVRHDLAQALPAGNQATARGNLGLGDIATHPSSDFASSTVVASVENLGGVVGDGSTIDTTALRNALANAPANARLVAHSGHAIKIDDSITLPKPLCLDGLNIVQSAGGKPALILNNSAAGSWLRHVTVTGVQYTTNTSGEVGIQLVGTSAASPLTGVLIESPTVSSFGQYGIYAQFVSRVEITGMDLSNLSYAGLMFLSATECAVRGGRVRNVVQGTGASNSYGVSVTQLTPGTDPPSSDIVIDSVLVDGVPNWNAFDTHSGQGVKFIGCKAKNAKNGIWAVTDSANAYAVAGLEIVGCDIDSGVDDGSASSGIVVQGAGSVLGSPIHLAIGPKIVGNTVHRYGSDVSGTSSGGIELHYTAGAVVTGNVLDTCAAAGIVLYHDNYGFHVADNTIYDTWMNAANHASGVYVASDYNTGHTGPNTMVRGSKSSTYPFIYATVISNLSHNDIRHISGFVDSAIPTVLSDPGGLATMKAAAPWTFTGTTTTAGRTLAARTATGSTTILQGDDTLFMNATSATATLPAVSATAVGKRYTVKNLNSTALTVAAAGSDTIEQLTGASTGASVSLTQGTSVTVQLDSSGVWRLV